MTNITTITGPIDMAKVASAVTRSGRDQVEAATTFSLSAGHAGELTNPESGG